MIPNITITRTAPRGSDGRTNHTMGTVIRFAIATLPEMRGNRSFISGHAVLLGRRPEMQHSDHCPVIGDAV